VTARKTNESEDVDADFWKKVWQRFSVFPNTQ